MFLPRGGSALGALDECPKRIPLTLVFGVSVSTPMSNLWCGDAPAVVLASRSGHPHILTSQVNVNSQVEPGELQLGERVATLASLLLLRPQSRSVSNKLSSQTVLTSPQPMKPSSIDSSPPKKRLRARFPPLPEEAQTSNNAPGAPSLTPPPELRPQMTGLVSMSAQPFVHCAHRTQLW